MKLVLDKKHGNRIEFVIKGLTTTFANMVRRYGLSRVPVLAIGNVTFYDNSSAFWDEYIAHRLGLVPLTTPDKTPESAEIVFSLDAEGPKTVYASDMVSSDKDILVAQGAIPLVTLGQNQHLRFEAKAVLGIARKHARFQAGLLSYGVEGEDLRFFVESFFQMGPADVVLRTCDLIEADLEAVEEALGKKSEKKKAAKAKAPKKVKAAPEKSEDVAEKEVKKPRKAKVSKEKSEGAADEGKE